jgi:uncharacterized protein (TIGR04255 family)
VALRLRYAPCDALPTEDLVTGNLYRKPPLVEVIVEVRWQLIGLQAVPDAAVDPLFPALETSFLKHVAQEGFGHLERLVPPGVPLELIAYSPVHRIRREPNKWPLFQLGPGIMTCNIVPPYDGWGRFRELVDFGLNGLFSEGKDSIKISALMLRYLDAFTAEHGLADARKFLKEDLSVSTGISPELVGKYSNDPAKATTIVENTMPVADPENSRITTRFAEGKKEGAPAVIADWQVRTEATVGTRDNAMKWFDAAHGLINKLFHAMVSERVLNLMEPTGGKTNGKRG